MQDFHSLDVWKNAHTLTLSVYQATQALSRDEIFGITMQMRRGATSIATRIAEGCGREGNMEFAVDLRKAIAACSEVEYLILLAKDLHHLKPDIALQLTNDTVQVRKMLFGLLRKL
jgi:four helix bundle protein